MNPPLDDLESELSGLRPARPPARLERRLDRALAVPPPGLDWVAWIRRWGLGFGAGAAVLVALLWLNRPAAPPFQPAVAEDAGEPSAQGGESRWTQTDATAFLVGAEDEGVLYVDPSTPFRRVKCRFLDASQWRDGRQGVSVEIVRPREDLILVPLRVY